MTQWSRGFKRGGSVVFIGGLTVFCSPKALHSPK
jgi:hypothetical protein